MVVVHCSGQPYNQWDHQCVNNYSIYSPTANQTKPCKCNDRTLNYMSVLSTQLRSATFSCTSSALTQPSHQCNVSKSGRHSESYKGCSKRTQRMFRLIWWVLAQTMLSVPHVPLWYKIFSYIVPLSLALARPSPNLVINVILTQPSHQCNI